MGCGNHEAVEGARSDSPTADINCHSLVCAWASCRGARLHSADVASAYLQGLPLDRVVIMKRPPGVDPEVYFIVRVPVYGITDSGRGLWLRLDSEGGTKGFRSSKLLFGLYYLMIEGKCEALMATHVDDLLYAPTPIGAPKVQAFLNKFKIGTSESDSFRYCGK